MRRKKKQKRNGTAEPAAQTPKTDQQPALTREDVVSIAGEVARAEIAKHKLAPFPSLETLAIMASNVAKGASLEHDQALAVSYAAKLYNEAWALLHREMELREAVEALPRQERASVAKRILQTLCSDPNVVDRLMRRIEHADVPEDVWRGIEDAEDGRLVDMETALYQQPPGPG